MWLGLLGGIRITDETMYSLGCEYESLLPAWFTTVMDKSAS